MNAYILDLEIYIREPSWDLNKHSVCEQIRGLVESRLPEYRIWNIYPEYSTIDIMKDITNIAQAASEYIKVIKTLKEIFGKCSLATLRILPKTKNQLS